MQNNLRKWTGIQVSGYYGMIEQNVCTNQRCTGHEFLLSGRNTISWQMESVQLTTKTNPRTY